ncbi:MAG: 4Fe-4S binding protein [Planctomycetes bacterium]|nr:4Fe-4S binding protein [Planctomycetota bacterium]
MHPDKPNPQDSSADRRAFFRRLMLGGLNRLDEAAQKVGGKLQSAMDRVENADQGPPTDDIEESPARRWLRPPGALTGGAFEETCSRCGKCVEVCPAQCIRIEEGIAGGLPHIIARQSPCVVCTGLDCMTHCPSGALKLVESPAEIAMGVALVDHDRCLRSSREPGRPGEDCRVCINDCPVGQTALGLDGYGRVQVRPGCIGCGVCERSCPTEPASIWVVPV